MSGADAAAGTVRLDACRARYPNWLDYAGYAGFHAAAAAAFAIGVDAADLALCAAGYVVQMMGATLCYHRYFAHKAFKTSRGFQFVLALWGTLSVEKGPLWWASVHRHHHRYADTPLDVHSPLQRSFVYAHCGWFLDRDVRGSDLTLCPEFAGHRELVWLTVWNPLPVAAYALAIFLAFGASGLLWGFFVSTVLVWHATHAIGSLGHRFGGYRRFATADNSRNKPLLALLLLGEGYHNNHHYAPYSARHGFAWWEIDVNWWVIAAFARLGLVWDVRLPPAGVVHGRGAGGERLVRDIEAWISGLRTAVRAAVDDAAARAKADGLARDIARHGIDARIDAFAAAAQDALHRDPERLKPLFSGLCGDLSAGLAAPARAAVAAAIERELAHCRIGHLLT